MLDMRLRLPELMAEKGIKTAYALHKASREAISLTTAQRLVRAQGRPDRIDFRTLDALCATLNAKPWQLLESDDEPLPPAIAKRR